MPDRTLSRGVSVSQYAKSLCLVYAHHIYSQKHGPCSTEMKRWRHLLVSHSIQAHWTLDSKPHELWVQDRTLEHEPWTQPHTRPWAGRSVPHLLERTSSCWAVLSPTEVVGTERPPSWPDTSRPASSATCRTHSVPSVEHSTVTDGSAVCHHRSAVSDRWYRPDNHGQTRTATDNHEQPRTTTDNHRQPRTTTDNHSHTEPQRDHLLTCCMSDSTWSWGIEVAVVLPMASSRTCRPPTAGRVSDQLHRTEAGRLQGTDTVQGTDSTYSR